MEDLDNKGFIFLKDVYEEEIIHNFMGELSIFLKKENIYQKIVSKTDHKCVLYYVNNEYSLVNSFKKLQNYPLPVIDIRGNRDVMIDKGMIDIHNIDKLFPQIDSYFNIDLITKLVQKSSGWRLEYFRTNLYICNSVENPAPFHSLDNNMYIKYYIFLSDIQNLSYGPNAFIKFSHRKRKKMIKSKNIEIIYGKKGDVLIIHQSGLHKRIRQNKGKASVYLVYTYKIVK